MMGKFDTWLAKAKATNLRTWLNVHELDQRLEAREGRPMKVWALSQGTGGFRILTIRIDKVQKRINTVVGSRDVLEDLVLECTLIDKEDKERPVVLKASQFMPDSESEWRCLSRIFPTEMMRDQFLEDVNFCLDLIEQDAVETHKRNASTFFRRFLGGIEGPPESPA